MKNLEYTNNNPITTAKNHENVFLLTFTGENPIAILRYDPRILSLWKDNQVYTF